MLEIRLLGGLSATLDGRPVELPADARARELLARLALAPAAQPRSVLAGRLRPDVPEESARKTLRSALYELRRALGPVGQEAVVVARDRIGLSDDVRIDVREFRRRLAEGDLEGAAGAGAGELLAGFDGDWALRAREEHAAELAGVQARLAAAAEEAGDLPAAIDWTRRRLDVEPLAEAAHRDLIRLLALGGDRPAALAAARGLAERLRSELGVPPSPATRALEEDVRRGRVARPAAAAPALPPVLAATEAPAGRDAELERLAEAWAQAGTGRLRFALVTGEPGIGKTTLAGELARRAHAAGGAVLLGRSDEHALVPFQPWVEALERLLEALPPGDAEHWLAAHGGALARLLPARSPAREPAGPRERYLAFELVRALLEDAGAQWPVLLVLDDVHVADADSLALVRHLGRSAARARLLVLLCARPAELAPPARETLAELRRESLLVHVELAGLDEEAVAAVLARRTGAADRDTARRYRARSGGNPFFLDELLREAQEAGREIDAPPAAVRDVMERRLARLGAPTLSALELAAACGMQFEAATLAAAGDDDMIGVLEALDVAIAAGLIAPADRGGRYAFAHALVAETILASLTPSRRAQLHVRIAEVLASRHENGETGAGEVVRHLRAAVPLAGDESLARWELAAAREAAAALAHSDAAAHYEAALSLRGRGEDRERAELLLALGHAHDRAGRRERARGAFAQAAAIARTAGDGSLLARASLGHGGTVVVIAAADATNVRLLEEALERAAPVDGATSARLLARLSTELYYDDPSRARELSGLAVEHARAARDAAALAAALNARRVALWTPHHASERLSAATEMLAAARAAGEREAVLQARNWRVVDLIELGRMQEAAAEIDAYAALADEVALPHFRWYVPLWRATLAMLGGRWEEARELSGRMLALGRAADDPNAPMFAGIQRHHLLYTQRRAAELDRDRLAAGGATSPAPAEWLVNLALIDAESGAIEEARRRVRDLSRDGCRAFAMDVNWHAACVLADAALLVGDADAAAGAYALLEPHAHLFPVVARAAGCLGSAELYVGRLAARLGRPDEAVARLRRAVQENERVGAEPAAVAALLGLGEALLGGGEPKAARDILQQAAGRAEQLGLATVSARARRLLA